MNDKAKDGQDALDPLVGVYTVVPLNWDLRNDPQHWVTIAPTRTAMGASPLIADSFDQNNRYLGRTHHLNDD